MDNQKNNGMCRCCASEGTFKDVKTAYQWMGEEEVYAEMLRECLDISLCPDDAGEVEGGICEVCITQLRNASNFKKQVLHTEEQFKRSLQEGLFKSDIVKVEVAPTEGESDNDNDMSEDYGTEFEVPVKTETVEEPKAKKRGAKAIKASTSRVKKLKAEDGESSKRKRRQVCIKTESEDEKLNFEVIKDITIKPKQAKGEVLERHRATVREILLCSNATPIRSKTGIGYSCSFCIKQYPDPKDLKKHTIETHSTEEKASFMKGKDLSKFYVKMDITKLQCTLCELEIATIEEIMNHLSEFHKKIVYTEVKSQILPFTFDGDGLKCFVCRNSVHNFRVLVEHMNVHYRNYICKDCDAGFVSQSILFQHLKTHKIGTFKCDYCTKIFETLLKKRAHERVVHTHSNVLNKCGYCSETFKDYWQREKHLASAHGVASIYKCQACDKTFQHQKGLRIHTKRDHLMERPHACTECDMKFFTGKKLKEHMVKHTGLREFQCEICLKSYGRKKTLNQHMRVHESYCKFECKHCGQGFVHRTSWVGHMRSKHGEQP